MKFSLLFAAGALAAPAAKDLSKRAITDVQILNYALTLEHLESTFYSQGIAKFGESGFLAANYTEVFYKNLMEISKDEATHVSFLTSAIKGLGYKAVAACEYDFGYTDVPTFIATASILEGVGVTAYLGAASSIMSGTYLTYAGSILTVESRHNAYLRSVGKPNRSPFPQSFDVPMDFDEVYSLASQFITKCPKSNPKLPVKAFPVLEILPRRRPLVYHGAYFKVQATEVNFTQPIYGYFIYTTGPVQVPVNITEDPTTLMVKAPSVNSGVAGQSYFVVTSSEGVTDDTIIAGPAIIPVKTDYLPDP